MKLYIKQHIFSWGDKFSVYDKDGNEKYFVKGDVFTFGKHLHVFDTNDNEIATIDQKLFSFLPTYYVSVNGNEIAEVVKEISFFSNKYSVRGLDWDVTGNIFDHEYEVREGSFVVASVAKEWFTWGDAYEIDIAPDADEVAALAVVLVIDACLARSNDD